MEGSTSVTMFPSFSLLLTLLVGLSAVRAQIVSGARWTDTSGNPIQAHGAGLIKVRINERCIVCAKR